MYDMAGIVLGRVDKKVRDDAVLGLFVELQADIAKL
jgi:hypothetical protein